MSLSFIFEVKLSNLFIAIMIKWLDLAIKIFAYVYDAVDKIGLAIEL